MGWLTPTEAHRERMLDMSPRVKRARTIAMAAMGLGNIAIAPTVGWLMLPLFAASLLTIATLDGRIARARHPERPIAQSISLTIVLMGLAVALSGGAESPAMPLILVPVVVSAARFRTPVVWAMAGLGVLCGLAGGLAHGPGELIDHPLPFLSLVILSIGVTAAITAMTDAELQFRSQSILDPLTGLLNRTGLEGRFAELAEQARLLDRPICLIACDLDQFKAINDSHGHQRGDAVLSAIGYELRKVFRSFELVYRLGGEEFLVMLPGVDLPSGVEMAETMRTAIEVARPGGVFVTASFGVSAGIGNQLELNSLFNAADQAMYQSKRAGRNRVTGSGGIQPPSAADTFSRT